MEEKRNKERRLGKERRTGKFDEAYKRLVDKDTFSDSRKESRRKHARRSSGVFTLSDEEKYAIYVIGSNKSNFDRNKIGLVPKPVLTFQQWKIQEELKNK